MKAMVMPLLAVATLFVGSLLISAYTPVYAQEIRAENTSLYRGDGRWDWMIYLAADPEIFNRIASVEYTLHLTFPIPVRTIPKSKMGTPERAFALSTNGWGVFEIPIKVVLDDGSTILLNHMLRFETTEDTRFPVEADHIATAGKEIWTWKVFIKAKEADPDILRNIQCVQYTLRPDSLDSVKKESCEIGNSAYPFSIEGRSPHPFKIAVRVYTRDGRIKQIIHHLKFIK